jgi:hypothetical protein
LTRPQLRGVEVLPVKTSEGEVICLRDPLRVVEEPMLLSPAALPVLSVLDGKRDLEEVQAAVTEHFGAFVDMPALRELVLALDENGMLEGKSFDQRLISLRLEFAEEAVRKAILAGRAYSSDPEALTRELTAYYTPGDDTSEPPAEPPRALIAPHIDFGRGGAVYAEAYKRLPPEKPPALVVILGTAHTEMYRPLCLCAKDFETPLGTLPCPPDLSRELTNRLGLWILEDEFIHRGEHSVEFQAVWLKHRFPKAQPAILPLLCGGFQSLVAKGRSPGGDDRYNQGLEAIREAVAAWSRENGPVLYLASSDLSHVGPQFGDAVPVSPRVARAIRLYDQGLLNIAAAGDAEDFFNYNAATGDRTNVCGLSSIYTLLRLTGGSRGRILSYDQWVDPDEQGLVSFAGVEYR